MKTSNRTRRIGSPRAYLALLKSLGSVFQAALAWFDEPFWLTAEARRDWHRHIGGISAVARWCRTTRKKIGDSLVTLKGAVCSLIVALLLYAAIAAVAFRFAAALPGDSGAHQAFVSDLWQANAGLLSATFAVAILVLQLRATPGDAGDLFKFSAVKSGVVPVTAFGFLNLALTGLTDLVLSNLSWEPYWIRSLCVASSIFFFLSVLASLIMCWRTFILVNPSSLDKIRIESIEQECAEAVDMTARSVLAEGILIRHCDRYGIQPYGLDVAMDSLYAIRSKSTGVVSDVHLGRLRRCAAKLHQQINLVGEPSYRMVLLRRLGNEVSEGDVLARIHSDDYTESTARLCRNAFRVKPRSEGSTDRLLLALGSVKDEAATHLWAGKTVAFGKTIETYLHMAESMLEMWHDTGLAIESSSTPLGHWGRTPLFSLPRYLEDILRWSVQSGNQEAIGQILYLPIRILRVATQANDFGLARSMTSLSILAYALVAPEESSPVRAFVIDRSWRYLRKYADYRLIPEMAREGTSHERRTQLATFLLELIGLYNRLAKAAIDHQDPASFEAYGNTLEHLAREPNPDRAVSTAAAYDMHTDTESLTEAEAAKIAESRRRYEFLSSTRAKVDLEVKLIWFGLSAWVLRQLRGGHLDPAAGRQMLEFARSHLLDFGELSSLYFERIEAEGQSLGWDSWDYPKLPIDGLRQVDTESWLRPFYCLHGLRLVPPDASDAEKTPVVPVRQIKYELDALKKACCELCEDSSLSDIVTDAERSNQHAFIALHEMAAEAAQRDQEIWVVQQPLNEARIEAVASELADSWIGHASIRGMMAELGGRVLPLADAEPPERPAQLVGLDIVVPKGAFLDDPYVQYIGLGQRLGTEMARREDSTLYDALTKRARIIVCEPDDINRLLPRVVADLRDSACSPSMILVDAASWRQSREHWVWPHVQWGFSARYQGAPRAIGMVSGVPLVETRTNHGNEALVVDLGAVGVLHSSCHDLSSACGLTVGVISQEMARRMAHDGGEEPTDDAVWRLMQNVRVSVLESIAFQITNPEAAVAVRVVDRSDHAEVD